MEIEEIIFIQSFHSQLQNVQNTKHNMNLVNAAFKKQKYNNKITVE